MDAMISQKELLSIILDSPMVAGAVMRYIDNLVGEYRISNDTSTGEEVYRNQGAIKGLLNLKDRLSRGVSESRSVNGR